MYDIEIVIKLNGGRKHSVIFSKKEESLSEKKRKKETERKRERERERERGGGGRESE